MAIRYSGDVEVRMRLVGRDFEARVRDPRWSGRLTVPHLTVDAVERRGLLNRYWLTRKPSDIPPAVYDEVAGRALENAVAVAKFKSNVSLQVSRDRRGNLIILRRFQAPCPV